MQKINKLKKTKIKKKHRQNRVQFDTQDIGYGRKNGDAPNLVF